MNYYLQINLNEKKKSFRSILFNRVQKNKAYTLSIFFEIFENEQKEQIGI